MHSFSIHLTYIQIGTAPGSFLPFLLHLFEKRYLFFLLFVAFLVTVPLSVIVFWPLMCLLCSLDRMPLTQVYGLIPRMFEIILTALQHI